MISRRICLQALFGAAASAQTEDAAALGPGRLLAARRRVMDPNFFETVVLLVRYGASDGAFGLTLNRPTAVKLSEALGDAPGADGRRERVFIGGPVEPRSFWLLLAGEPEEHGDIAVLPGLVCTAARERVRRAIADADSRFRAIAGYSGWAPGQLENELDRGDWTVHPGRVEQVLEVHPSELWDRLQRTTRLNTA